MSIKSLYFKIVSEDILLYQVGWSFILSEAWPDKLDLSQVSEESHTQKYTAAG